MALEKGDVTPSPVGAEEGRGGDYHSLQEDPEGQGQGAGGQGFGGSLFLETLVRIHRAGEGALYRLETPRHGYIFRHRKRGQCLQLKSADSVIKLLTDEMAAGVRARFAQALEKKGHEKESVEAGREFVAAYVEYLHYVEGLHKSATKAGHHEAETAEDHQD